MSQDRTAAVIMVNKQCILLVLTRLFVFQDTVFSIMISGNNKYLVSGSSDCSMKLFDFENKSLVHTFDNAHRGSLTSWSDRFTYFYTYKIDGILAVAISHDGELVASGSRDRSIKVFSTKNMKNIIFKENYHEGNSKRQLR